MLLDGYGNVLHFPAGSYREHMRDERSQDELALAMYTHTVREICSKVHREKSIKALSKSERRLYHRINKWAAKHGE